MHPTVFQQVLRAPFFNLPDTLRALHSVRGHALYIGRVEVERGRGLLSRLCGWASGLPPAMRDAPLKVSFSADERSETWQREFGGHRMGTRLRCRDKLLCERLGPLFFRFVLHTADGAIYWNVARVRLLGIVPLPSRLFSRVQCREYEQDDRYHFVVDASLPLAGRLIRYAGWLEPAGHDAA